MPKPSAQPADAAEQRFRLLIDAVRDYAIFMLDPGGHVETWNAGAERIKGYRADEIIGKHFSTFYSEDEVRTGKCEYELEVASREGRFEDEGWRIRKDGSRFWANVVISAVRDPAGTLVGFTKVTRDLTERRRAEDEKAARLAAEKSSRAKDAFLAMLGHELRNPLAPIVTALQVMKLRGDARTSREQQIIERQVNHIMHLVDDLLDISRITRGKIALRKQPLELRTVIARAIEVAGPQLEQRRHHFATDVPGEAILLDGDPARLTQVFANLLTNAAKYTDAEGHIALAARRQGGEVIVEVRDDGIGIDRSLLPNVFELFVQGAQSSDRSSGGLGLGLTLVRSLVELHGGSVEARSRGPGMGSTFTVRLPVVEAPPVEESSTLGRATNHSTVTPRRLLLVDDNDDARDLLCDALTMLGHEVRTAGDGEEALEVVKGFAPEVAILDIGLPGMDGYELAARLRRELAAPLRLIALTGYGQAQDRTRSHEAGFDVHLVKPIDLGRLVASLD